MNSSNKLKIGFFVTHPIQYQIPLFRYLHNNPNFNFKVYYLSDFSFYSYDDKEFIKNFNWDIDMKSGYEYKVLQKNHKNSKLNFFNPLNFSFFHYLIKDKIDIVWVHGWGQLSNIFLVIQAKLLGKKVFIRGESSKHLDHDKSKFKLLLKKIFFSIFFKLIDKFLYIGKNNLDFYKDYIVNENKFIFCPYVVDNNFFNKNYSDNNKDNFIKFLFCGKFIHRKRPIDILMAISLIKEKTPDLLSKSTFNFVGSGQLEEELTEYINKKNLNNIVTLSGFQNQSDIVNTYLSSDVLIIPSEKEPWGLVVNEAMASQCAIISSTGTGCSKDLVVEDYNGYVYETGDIDALSKVISKLIINKNKLEIFKKNSLELISKYSFETISTNLSSEINYLD